jgi:hypothetical protein
MTERLARASLKRAEGAQKGSKKEALDFPSPTCNLRKNMDAL